MNEQTSVVRTVVFSIQGLKNEEAFSLIRKYDEFNESQIKGEDLIRELSNGKKLEAVKSFLENPLMVSLLYVSYLHDRSVDMKKTTFYRHVYEALYKRHDILKPLSFEREKRTKLGEDDFFNISCALAFVSLSHGVAYERGKLRTLIEEAKGETGISDFKAADLIDDLLKAVPLFVIDGVQLRWSHKSFQEYFMSSYICQHIDKRAMFREIYKVANNRNYWNILEMCYDLDYKTFKMTIMYDVAKKAISQLNIVSDKNRSKISDDALSLRFSICFGRFLCLIPTLSDNNEFNRAKDFVRTLNNSRETNAEDYIVTQGGDAFSIACFAANDFNLLMLLGRKKDTLILSHSMLEERLASHCPLSEQAHILKKIDEMPIFLNDYVALDDTEHQYRLLTRYIGIQCNFNRPLRTHENYVVSLWACRELIIAVELDLARNRGKKHIKSRF